MTEGPRHRTILFADVVASTELYEELGDADALARIGPCLAEVNREVERHGGVVVKSLGDGILAAFGDDPAAVGAALAMPECAARHSVQVSVGVHTGEVLVEDGDVFGQAVNVASRLAGLAKPSEVLVTEDVLGHLAPSLRMTARRMQNVAIKGLSEPIELFALGHEGPAATMAVSEDLSLDDLATALRVQLGEQTWSVTARGRLRLGRDAGNEVVVAGDRVSRNHAVIAWRRGKFVLSDQSVNGTWLSEEGVPAHLLREEATLHGPGVITLGVAPDHPLAEPITYRIVAPS